MPEARPNGSPTPSDTKTSDTKTFRVEVPLARGLTIRTAVVAFYAVRRDRPEELGTVDLSSSSPLGDGFDITLPVRGDGELFYAVATIEWLDREGTPVTVDGVVRQLVTVFTADDRLVALTERGTVATAFAFARFLTVDGVDIVLSDPRRTAHLALGMRDNLVHADGAISPVIQAPPNGLETNSWPMLNFLGGLVSYAMTDAEVYDRFLEITSARSLFGGLVALPHDPWLGGVGVDDDGLCDVNEIYDLTAGKPQPFSPSLPELDLPRGRSPVPNQWTLTVKVNRSGAQNFLIAGVGLVDFDRNDRAWLAINTRQGTPNSATFAVVLEPDGSPASFSPVFGGGVLGAGFGIAASPARDTIAIGNFGWGATEWNPQHGSVSLLSCDGALLTPSEGYVDGLSRVQGVIWDRDGNLWMSSWGSQDPMPPTPSKLSFESRNSAVVEYVGGDPRRMMKHSFDSPYHLTFDVAVDDEGNCYVSNSGSASEGVRSSVHKVRIADDGQSLEHVACWTSDHGGDGLETFRQIAVGPDGHIYVVGVSSSRVVRLDPISDTTPS